MTNILDMLRNCNYLLISGVKSFVRFINVFSRYFRARIVSTERLLRDCGYLKKYSMFSDVFLKTITILGIWGNDTYFNRIFTEEG